MPDLFGIPVPDVVSELLGMGSSKQIWHLKMKDPPETDFAGQFIAENPIENISQQIGETSTVGSAQPALQFQRGVNETFSFLARIFAEYSYQNVHEKIEIIKSFVRLNDELKRPPLFIFTYGSELSFECFVQSVGGIKYDEPRQDGSLRGATFNINLLKITELPQSDAAMGLSAIIKTGVGAIAGIAGLASMGGLINIPGGSLHTISRVAVVRDGDTFESIAAKEYGSALHGDILRRVNPDKRILKAGDKVTLVVRDEIISMKVTPQSIMLKDNKDAIRNRKTIFLLKNKSKTIYI